MRAPDIKIGQKDPGALARSATARYNESVFRTPDLALDIAHKRPVGPDVLEQKEFSG